MNEYFRKNTKRTLENTHLAGRKGWRFYGWAGVSIPLLEALPACKRQPVQVLYPPLLGVFAGVTFIDSREFPPHWVSISSPKCVPIPDISRSTLPIHNPQHYPFYPHLHPSPVHCPNLLYFTFPGRSMCPPLSQFCYLASVGVWIISWLSFI